MGGKVVRPLVLPAKGPWVQAPPVVRAHLENLFLGPLRTVRLARWHQIAGLGPVNLGSIPVRAFRFNRVITLNKF